MIVEPHLQQVIRELHPQRVIMEPHLQRVIVEPHLQQVIREKPRQVTQKVLLWLGVIVEEREEFLVRTSYLLTGMVMIIIIGHRMNGS